MQTLDKLLILQGNYKEYLHILQNKVVVHVIVLYGILLQICVLYFIEK